MDVSFTLVLTTTLGPAVVLSLILVPLVRAIAPRIGAIDHPGPISASAHTRPVARTGGLAIWIAAAPIIGVGLRNADLVPEGAVPWLIVGIGGSLLVAVGLIDDIRRLNPRVKLFAGIAVAIAVSAFGPSLALTGSAALDFVISVCWLTFFPQAFNAFDGLDGLAAGSAFLSLGFLGAWLLACGCSGAATATWVLAGATLGFLFYNFPPSRGIFLGDSGSLFLGFALAFLTLQAVSAGDGSGGGISLVPLFFVCIPVVEAVFVILRRALNGFPILRGDRLHLYDAIHERLGSMRWVAVSYYAATILVSALAWWIGAAT